MRKVTKMMLAAGRKQNERSEMAPRMGYGEPMGGYDDVEDRRRGGSRMEYDNGESRRGTPRMGYDDMESRRRGSPRMEYDTPESREPRTRGEYDNWEEEARRGRRTRRTRSGGYDEEDEEDDPRSVYQGEENHWPTRREYESPLRGGYAPRREQMPEAHYGRHTNIIGFNTAPHGGELMSAQFTRQTAEEWMARLQNEDGTTGPHWTFEQAKQLMAQKGIAQDPVEFWAALNMVYSDYCKVMKKVNANTVDAYAGLAEAFLNDKDAGPDKLSRYFEYVVK